MRKFVMFFIITSKIFQRFYFALFDVGFALKTLKLAFIGF